MLSLAGLCSVFIISSFVGQLNNQHLGYHHTVDLQNVETDDKLNSQRCKQMNAFYLSSVAKTRTTTTVISAKILVWFHIQKQNHVSKMHRKAHNYLRICFGTPILGF